MARRFLGLCLIILLAVGLWGCGDDDDHHDSNTIPVADSGVDQNVTTGSVVTLDGSASSDADGDLLSYAWSFTTTPTGSTASLSDVTVVRPTFTPDVDGDYVLALVVNDGTDDSAADSVTITASTANSAPVANAGTDQNVTTGTLVTLDGSGSSDADGDTLSFSWSFTSVPAGSSAALSAATVAAPTFTPDLDGDYVLALVVNDGTDDSVADSVIITSTTANSAPVANAGLDQTVLTGSQVTLDGSGSSDADGDTLTYTWAFTSIPSGSSASLSDANVTAPTFTADLSGDYVLSLVVNDGLGDSLADSVTITAAGFIPPANTVAVNFTIDDTANQTYTAADGLAWKGSFSFNSTTRLMTINGAWSGPYVMLYDDGPWTTGGHEPEGATAGDSLWGVTVWVSNSATQNFEYGAISGSVNGSDGSWIWVGSNGTFTVTSGSSTPIDAPGLVIPAFGTIDLQLTIDISANGSNLDPSFAGADYTDQVNVKGSAWGWNTVALVDDGTKGDVTAGDGIYTFVLSENIGAHDGLLHSGDTPEFIFVLGGVEYTSAGVALSSGVNALIDSGSGWSTVPVETLSSGSMATFVTVP